jgi:hypothetical protein
VVDATPINLKERIAALQQLSNTSNPPPSLTLSSNNDVSPALQPPTANANIKLREKIARFEKKGGVPVPRSSFGLGAPPPQDGHTKRHGELYGNRIPHPVRVASGPQGAVTPSGHSHPPSATMKFRGNNRRSFSLSTVNTLMASEFAGGADTPSTSPAGEPVHQISRLSPQPSAELKDKQDKSSVTNSLPAIVISQGEGDSITEATGLPLEEAQLSSGVDTEVPNAAESVIAPSASSPDIDSSPILPFASDVSVSPPLPSSPSSALSSPPDLDAAPAGSPTLSPALSPSLAPTRLDSPLAHSISQQTSNNKTDLVSSDDESNISTAPVIGIALTSSSSSSSSSSQFLPVESISLEDTAQDNYRKENIGVETKADIKGNNTQPPALDLDSGITQPHALSKVAAKDVQPESETPSPTTPHATQVPLPETFYSTSIQSPTSPEIHSQSGSSTRPASTIKSMSSPNHVQLMQKAAEGEQGSDTVLHQESSLHQNLSSYRAVVHNKRRDDLPNSRSLTPQTPQVRRASSGPLGNGFSYPNVSGATSTAMPVLPVIYTSPGLGDLSDLLQSTVLLEQTLETGVISTDPSIPAIVTDDDGDVSREIVTTRPDGVEVRRLSRGEAEENKRTLAKLQAKREEQAKSKLRSSFRNTLARAVGGESGEPASNAVVAASLDIGEPTTTTSQLEQQPQYYSKRFKSPSVPHLLDTTPDDGLTRSKTPDNQIGRANKPASLASSKSTKSRFPNFRRLTSSSKSSDGHGGRLARNSISTSSEISSEESSPAAVTPPDVATEFGETVKARKGMGNSEMSWQGSPQKKGKDTMLRAATFAGKIWSRTRTRSGASTLSTQSSLGKCNSSIILPVWIVDFSGNRTN